MNEEQIKAICKFLINTGNAVLHELPDNGGAYVIFPWDIRKKFGKPYFFKCYKQHIMQT